MWSLLVEPDEVVEQPVVEGVDVVEEEVFVELDEFFLDGSVKAFGMGVHLWAIGISQPTHCTVVQHGLGETCLELAAVIR